MDFSGFKTENDYALDQARLLSRPSIDEALAIKDLFTSDPSGSMLPPQVVNMMESYVTEDFIRDLSSSPDRLLDFDDYSTSSPPSSGNETLEEILFPTLGSAFVNSMNNNNNNYNSNNNINNNINNNLNQHKATQSPINYPTHFYNNPNNLMSSTQSVSFDLTSFTQPPPPPSSTMGGHMSNGKESDTSDPSNRKRRKREDGFNLTDLPDMIFNFHPYILPSQPRYKLYSPTHTDITHTLDMDVRADKNVHYSDVDDAWIHYKQNHFQITSELKSSIDLPGTFLVETQPGGYLQPVDGLYVDVYAVKSTNRKSHDEEEATVELNQTGKSRTKEENHVPQPCLLQNGRAIHSRLRFQCSTAHNARTKNNETNPNQQFFRLVVTLFALSQGSSYPILKKVSDPLIVRGQNPGRYANGKVKIQPQTSPEELPPTKHISWTKVSEDATVIDGKVGINTSNPQEALSVHGNILVTGSVLKPSDQRIKENITPVDPSTQLKNISELQIYDYNLKEWKGAGQNKKKERGVLAQEVQRVMPYAVDELGNVTLNNGQTVQNLLVVNERILLFENIGATQELKRIVDDESGAVETLGKRVDELEDGTLKNSLGVESERTKLEKVIDYLTNDEFGIDRDDGTSCCYCSIFGLGPAWTMWLLGFFFPLFWIIGICYVMSWKSSTRRTAGFANLLTLAVYALYWVTFYLVAGRYFVTTEVFTIMSLLEILIGIALIITLSIFIRRRNRKRSQARYKLRDFMLRPKLYTYNSEVNLRDQENVEMLKRA